MNYQIEWGGEPVFGFFFGEIMAEGIENGMEELEELQLFGASCDGCAKWRYLQQCNNEGLAPYWLCDECRREVYPETEPGPHTHTCQQCDAIVLEDCDCETPVKNMWCSANCRAAFDL